MIKIEQFAASVFEKAKKKGFDAYELYYQSGHTLSLQSFECEISDYSDSLFRGVNFRGTVDGKSGSAFSEVLDDEATDLLVNKAYQAAVLIENDDMIRLVEKGLNYSKLNLYNDDLSLIENHKKVDFIIEQDKEALETGKIEKVQGAYYGDAAVHCCLFNSNGVKLHYCSNSAYAYVVVVAADGEKKQMSYDYIFSNDFKVIKESKVALKSVEKVNQMLGAKSLPTGVYKTVLSNEASASLLSVFITAFSAEATQKGLSLLKGSVGQMIASSVVSLIDNPHLENGLATTPFDGEGVPTFKKALIDKGRLKTLLHNMNTAQKEGVTTTGNASRGSFKSTIGVSPSNAYIESGAYCFDKILNHVQNGLIITEFEGLHAGANAVTGDFSLSAKGHLIKNGKRSYPINQIVVSGNYFEMLKAVEMVGDDLKFSMSPIGSPSIYVGDLTVAGE